MIIGPASRSSRRRGGIALIGMFFLTIALLLLVLVVFSGQSRYLKERMQISADAAALAAAEELIDDSWLSGNANDMQDMLARSRDLANEFARKNPIQGLASPVFANKSNEHDGDIVFGHFPLSGEQTFQFGPRFPAMTNDPPADLEHLDSVRIIIHRDKDHDKSQLHVVTTPTSPGGRKDGLAASIAVLDRYVYGFRPLGGQTTPFVPLALFSDPTRTSLYCWEKRGAASGTNDRFSFNRSSRSFSGGSDGIPEFKVRLGLRPKDDSASVAGMLIRTIDADLTGDGRVDLADIIAQIGVGGLRAGHLQGAAFDGRIALGDNGLLTVLATDAYPQASSARKSLTTALDDLRKSGRAFVFPLYRTLGNRKDAVSVCDFVACRIVGVSKKKTRTGKDDEEEDDTDDEFKGDGNKSVKRSIVLTLQLAMVSVPSAMTDARRKISGNPLPLNPYIAKVRLGR